MTDGDIDPEQFDLDGRSENNQGLATDFNTLGSTPRLRVYVGPYGKSLDSPEEAKAFLANLEDKVEAYVQAMDEDLSVDLKPPTVPRPRGRDSNGKGQRPLLAGHLPAGRVKPIGCIATTHPPHWRIRH